MLDTTYEAMRAVLRADPSVPLPQRNELLAMLRRGPNAKPERATPSGARLVRRKEAAARLGVSLRTLDKLSRELGLRRKLPGRRRALGITELDLNSLIAGRATE